VPGVLRNEPRHLHIDLRDDVDASALNPVSIGSSRWQNCAGRHCPGAFAVLAAAAPPQIQHFWQLATISQLSSICLPVPIPPWSVAPFCRRALTLMSKPFQWSHLLPVVVGQGVQVLDLPELRRMTLYKPVSVWPLVESENRWAP
jgi:hypothetical protein